jgi:hypothetical protein
MEQEEKFSPEESLLLIRSMIDKTKSNAAADSFYFLTWGWLTFIICIVQYVMLVFLKSPHHYYAWFLIWLGVIAVIVKSFKEKKEKKVVSYIDDSMKYLWTGIGITFFVLGWICAMNEWQKCFPLFIMLYGLGTFTSGCLIKFKPFVIGGIICWIAAPLASCCSYEWQILITAFALLVSYIIPGHLLQAKYSKK